MEITTKRVSYEADGQTLIGYLAYDPSAEESRPGVIVVHEWLGLNEYAMKRAVDLAKEGYVAFAADMYGGGDGGGAIRGPEYGRQRGRGFPPHPIPV
jgi:dienelactone hydrolase